MSSQQSSVTEHYYMGRKIRWSASKQRWAYEDGSPITQTAASADYTQSNPQQTASRSLPSSNGQQTSRNPPLQPGDSSHVDRSEYQRANAPATTATPQYSTAFSATTNRLEESPEIAISATLPSQTELLSQPNTNVSFYESTKRDAATGIQSTVVQGESSKITASELQEKGFLAHKGIKESRNFNTPQGRGKESATPKYKVSKQPEKDFKFGNVIELRWVERSDGGTVVTRGQGDSELSRVRRFVVVGESQSYCAALPILTYQGRGVGATGVIRRHHSIIYTGSRIPPLLPGESPTRGPPPDMLLEPAIQVIGERPENRLDPHSRLNFARVYQIDQASCEIRVFGRVHQSCMQALLYNFEMIQRELRRAPRAGAPRQSNTRTPQAQSTARTARTQPSASGALGNLPSTQNIPPQQGKRGTGSQSMQSQSAWGSSVAHLPNTYPQQQGGVSGNYGTGWSQAATQDGWSSTLPTGSSGSTTVAGHARIDSGNPQPPTASGHRPKQASGSSDGIESGLRRRAPEPNSPESRAISSSLTPRMMALQQRAQEVGVSLSLLTRAQCEQLAMASTQDQINYLQRMRYRAQTQQARQSSARDSSSGEENDEDDDSSDDDDDDDRN